MAIVAERELSEAVATVAARYNERAARDSVRWLADGELLDAIGDFMRAGDAMRARAAIQRWTMAWLGFLNRPVKRRA